MVGELSFVPKILLCGDEADFKARVDDRPFKIVGHVKFFGEVDGKQLNFFRDGIIFFNGKFQNVNDFLKHLATSNVDYLIFTVLEQFEAVYRFLAYKGVVSQKLITIEMLKSLPRKFFYDPNSEFQILAWLKILSIKTLLDVDAYFSRGKIFTKLENDLTEIDCISDEPLWSVMENIYTRTYKNFADVGFRHYDAALIVERPPMDFIAMFTFLANFTDCVITFARNGSELEQYIAGNMKIFSGVNGLRTATGIWIFINRYKPPENFCIYVVTHKPTPHEGKLPEGYKLIHAGRALNKDLGYLGDDTGDSISRLNPYLNEITALYWMWKNTSNEIIGLSHYRRFFTTADDVAFAYEKILTRDAALKILSRYDIIIKRIILQESSQREGVINTSGKDLTVLAEGIIKKYMMQAQPDYLDAFDFMLNSTTLYGCSMFVTRRNVFNAYCKWLFSFLIDATEEILRTINFETLQSGQRRVMGFFTERLFQVWLMKNHLRAKELHGMYIDGL